MNTIKLSTDLDFDLRVEKLSVEKLRDQDWDGVWGENYFWWTLITVLFWDEIFADIDGVRIARDMPSDFFQPTFYNRREDLIEKSYC